MLKKKATKKKQKTKTDVFYVLGQKHNLSMNRAEKPRIQVENIQQCLFCVYSLFYI